MNATLDAAPGWPERVIGGMCYVIMFAENEIIDPDADTLELHPKFARLQDSLARVVEPAPEKLLLEHSGCGHGRQMEQITIGLHPGDMVFVRYGPYSAAINAKGAA